MKETKMGLDEVPMKYRLELDELNRRRAISNIKAMKKEGCCFIGSDDELYVFPDFVQVFCFQCQAALKIRPWLAKLRDKYAPTSDILCPKCASKRTPLAFEEAMRDHIENFKGVLAGACDEAIQEKTKENLEELSFAYKNPQAFAKNPSPTVISKHCNKGIVLVSQGLLESIMYEPDSREFAEYVAYYEAKPPLVLMIEESIAKQPIFREMMVLLFGGLNIVGVFDDMPMDLNFNWWLKVNSDKIGKFLGVDKC